MSLRGLAARIGLAVAAFLVSAVVLEVALRILGIGGPMQLEPLYDRDEVHYVRERPWKPRRAWLDGPFLRVAVIGDSFTVGQGVNWDNTYPYRLLELLNLNAAPPAVFLRVFAKNGYNTIGELRFLDNALRWKADLIVLGIFINDSERPSKHSASDNNEGWLPRPPRGLMRTLTRASRFAEIGYERFEDLRVQMTSGGDNPAFEPESQGWKDFETALGIFAGKTDTAGIPLVAAILPTMHGLGPSYSRVPHERMGAALEKQGILYLDLLDAFLDKSSIRMQVYPGVDAHPSEIAHRIMAREIFDFLLEEKVLGDEYRPRAVLENPSRDQWLRQVRRFRDIVHYDP